MFSMLMFVWMLIVGLLIILPLWKIFEKAGFSGPLAILMLIPFINILMIFYLAFTDWPALKGKQPPQP